MANLKHEQAWRKAMDFIMDDGMEPVAIIDGVIQFMENHYDGNPFETRQDSEHAFKVLHQLRAANGELDAVERQIRKGYKGYYPHDDN